MLYSLTKIVLQTNSRSVSGIRFDFEAPITATGFEAQSKFFGTSDFYNVETLAVQNAMNFTVLTDL